MQEDLRRPEPPPIRSSAGPSDGASAIDGAAVEARALSSLLPSETPTFEPNRVLRWVYSRFFRHMRVDDRWSAAVREAASRGIVVYVMRSISVLDFLCLDYLLKRFRLPLVRFVNDLGLWILEPFGRGERRLRLRPQVPQEESLANVLHAQASALLFLRRPPSLGERAKGHGLDVDLIRTIVEQQRKLDRPVLLVPQTFVWTQRPPNRQPTLIDLIFGPREWPGRFRVLLRFMLNYRNAQLRSGEPFDVRAFLAEHQDLTDSEAADRIRYALLRRIEREREIVVGPAKKEASRIREEILRSPRVRQRLEAAAREQRKPLATVTREADAELRKLCAMMDPTVLGLFERFLRWLWTRIYDGLVIDIEGLERLREAARRGPVILLPSHKSHVDYLVLSYVMKTHALSAPLIAAGDNLSFFPLGFFLRRCGAFFIRRSFKGRKLYAALVDAYLRRVLVEGFNVEFFLEGGRSRTGKLLAPKLGLLTMVVEAGLKLPSVELSFVPVSIGYERIIEERSYARELAGGDKRPESVGGLLRSSRVLRSRYGRLYIQFGQVFGLRQLVDESLRLRGEPGANVDGEALRPTERRALIQRIAHRVTFDINRVTVVTPAALVATALLSHRRRGMTHADLLSRCAELLASLRRAGATVARPLLRDSVALVGSLDGSGDREEVRVLLDEGAVTASLSLFADSGLVETKTAAGEAIYSVQEAARVGLEYHKNAVLHFFVPSALVSAALVSVPSGSATQAELRKRVAELSKLFKYEFMFRADATFDSIFDDAVESMVSAGEVERSEDVVRAAPNSLVPVYASMLQTYFESYRLAASSLEPLAKHGSVRTKDWLKGALSRGNELYLSGEIELSESVSRPKLESALSAFRDLGIVALDAERVGPTPAMRGEGGLSTLVEQLERYLMR